MFADYHGAIVDVQYESLKSRAINESWADVSFDREGAHIYVTFQVFSSEPYRYLSHIDMSRYPVDPYWIGFINPSLPRQRWSTASDSDPRFWPWSPMPGLHGSFNIVFVGPFRTFWCRPCSFPFFYYHGEYPWVPAEWPLDRVVAHLRDAVKNAVLPNQWRPIQRQILLVAAANARIKLPADAGLGAK